MFPGRRLERDLIVGAELVAGAAIINRQRQKKREMERAVVAAETRAEVATATALATTAAVNAERTAMAYGTSGVPGYGTPGYGAPGYGTVPVGVGVANVESRPFKLQAEQTGMMVTVVPRMGSYGEHGVLAPKPAEPMNVNQQFRWEQAQAFPGCYLMVCAYNSNHVVRFTPRHPSGNLHVWNREPGNPLQAWRVNGHHIHPHGHPEMHFNINELTMHYHVSMEPQRFRILYI